MVKELYKKAKSILFADPEALYKEDHAVLGQPFYFPGENGRAVLLIHGWTSVPYELRRFGTFLNEKGYTVSGPTLTGHGAHPKDLKDVKWETWLEDVEKYFSELKEKHDKVYVAGTSMGASLVALLAARGADVSGIVLMAMPYRIRRDRMIVWFARFINLFKTYQKKYYPPGFGNSEFITRKISYQIYPIESALEVFRLGRAVRRELPRVTQPCLVMQSTHDHIVAKNNLEEIFSALGSEVKNKKYIEKAYHTFISDIRNEYVFEDILNFLEEN